MKSEEEILLAKIKAKQSSGDEISTVLQTDDRVLARISDGIYRQPASALRELIANAYDADATRVIVKTDAPRFSKISVEDDGTGMSEAALVRLIHHIGGSAKRTGLGRELGITSTGDSGLSPAGRRLIGKIGIGLFSVAQLTRNFRIITKREGAEYRLVADVTLLAFTEGPHEADSATRTGDVRIRSVPAKRGEHGTKIELLSIQPAAREFLQSKDLWDRVYDNADEGGGVRPPPALHVGRLSEGSSETIKNSEVVPWSESDTPLKRFKKLVVAVAREKDRRVANPSLGETLDRYLQTLWSLSLSLPLQYLNHAHPFDVPGDKLPAVYQLANKSDGQATLVELGKKETLRKRFDLKATSPENFEVLVDGVELRRPIDITAVADPDRPPLLFVGSFNADLRSLPNGTAGGDDLLIESYILWTPKVVPVEHIGVLVRIADASGTLFDPTYFSYPIAEKVRLRQLSGELFAMRGLDSALNIDRESFNFGHVHAKVVSAWVHRALRQLTNAQKKVQKEARDSIRGEEVQGATKEIWQIVRADVGRSPERVVLTDDAQKLTALRNKGTPAVSLSPVIGGLEPAKGAGQVAKRDVLKTKLAAIATLLQEYGLWEAIDYETQESLLRSIAKILETE